ncbi:hypothetical protein SMD44_08536 [Streptomyces alboflavus]|uniref:Uncharacterized protein n=1 Tax=Streptomyces alboflavus TaxID=67267 RepID=A0A1Z1WRM5_9ACTN|nr:hypothetical protein [Streptomyces alboflavus]ARX89049.1 hypothetical protein SMD44_08536 [Streptomyces alboflavus]
MDFFGSAGFDGEADVDFFAFGVADGGSLDGVGSPVSVSMAAAAAVFSGVSEPSEPHCMTAVSVAIAAMPARGDGLPTAPRGAPLAQLGTGTRGAGRGRGYRGDVVGEVRVGAVRRGVRPARSGAGAYAYGSGWWG